MSNKSHPHAMAESPTEHGHAPRSAEPNVVRIDAHKNIDPLQSFKPGPSRRWSGSSWNKGAIPLLVAAILIVAVSAGGGVLYLSKTNSSANTTAIPPLSGRVALNSRPDGVIVSIDGIGRGITPL